MKPLMRFKGIQARIGVAGSYQTPTLPATVSAAWHVALMFTVGEESGAIQRESLQRDNNACPRVAANVWHL